MGIIAFFLIEKLTQNYLGGGHSHSHGGESHSHEEKPKVVEAGKKVKDGKKGKKAEKTEEVSAADREKEIRF